MIKDSLIMQYNLRNVICWYFTGNKESTPLLIKLELVLLSRHAQERTPHHPQTLRPPYDYAPSIHVPPPPPVPQQPRYLAEGTDW